MILKYELPESRAAWEARQRATVAAGRAEASWPPRDAFWEDCKAEVRKLFPGGAKDVKATRRLWLGLGVVGTLFVSFFFWRAIYLGCALSAVVAGGAFVVVNARMTHEGGHFGLSTRWWVNRAVCLPVVILCREHFSRLDALLFTAMAWVFILLFAFP